MAYRQDRAADHHCCKSRVGDSVFLWNPIAADHCYRCKDLCGYLMLIFIKRVFSLVVSEVL